MTEKNFLFFLLAEGVILLVLGLCILILPKISTITLGVIICLGFIIYGICKIISAIMTKNYSRHYILNIILGGMITTLGTVLFFAPSVNLAFITSIVGIYFIIESIATKAFAFQTKNTLYYWWVNIIIATIQFLIGLFVILGLPNISFWIVGLFIGLDFLMVGSSLISLYISNKYLYL